MYVRRLIRQQSRQALLSALILKAQTFGFLLVHTCTLYFNSCGIRTYPYSSGIHLSWFFVWTLNAVSSNGVLLLLDDSFLIDRVVNCVPPGWFSPEERCGMIHTQEAWCSINTLAIQWILFQHDCQNLLTSKFFLNVGPLWGLEHLLSPNQNGL